MKILSAGRQRRAKGRARTGYRLAAFTAAIAVAVLPAVAAVSPASAAPKGTLTAVSGTTAGLTPGQDVNLTLTNYPSGDVLVKYCELVMVGFSMTVGDCLPTPPTVVVPDAGGGRGTIGTTAAAVKMIGAKDCSTTSMCGFVTASGDPLADSTKKADSDVKLTVAFGDVPALEVLDRAPTAAANSPVTVKGTGFRPGITLRLTQCNNSLPAGGKCRSTLNEGYAEPTSDANGAFEAELNVSASYVSGADTLICTDGSITCGVQTSSKTSGADRTQQAMVDLDYGGSLTASKASGISSAGESITATGAGFEPNADLFLVNCDTAVPAGGACDMARVKQVHVDGTGAFSQAITVGSFAGTNCQVKACGLQTSKVGAGGDLSQTATLPLAFVDPASLTASKTSGIAAAGESITATGAGFQPNTNLFLALCDTAVPAGGACDMTNFKQVTTNASGGFSQAITVGSFTGTDCLVKTCGLQTSKAGAGADTSQVATLPLSFVAAAVPTAKLTSSKTSGISAAGESITATGAGFQPNTNLFLALCDTAVPAGGACDMTNFKQVTTDASGGFSQAIKVGSFTGTDCLVKTCGLQTSKVGAGADTSQVATLPLSFVAAAVPTAKLTSSKTTGINSSGENVKVNGSGFKPGVSLFIALCNTKVPAGGACDMVNFKQVKTDGSGAFPATSMKVVGSFTGGNGSKVDCLIDPCALQTSRVGAGSDATQTATLPLTFVKGTATAGKAKLMAPKVVKAGSTIKVKGSNFKPGQQIVTALCKKSAKVGKSCWTAKAKTAKVKANGSFTVKIKTADRFKSKQGNIKCGKSNCAVKTWNKKKPQDRSSQVTHKFKFGKKTSSARGTTLVVRNARSGASMSVSKTSGVSKAGESVTVKGSGFNPNVGLFVALCNTDVPAGGACDMTNFKQVKTDGSGAFPAASIKLVSSFTGGDGSKVDCMSDPCALQTSQVGAGADTTQTVAVPISFSAAAAADDGGSDDNGGSDTGGDDDGTPSGGSAANGSSGNGSSSDGSVLPATGAGDYLWISIAGLFLLIGGVALTLRSRASNA